MYSPENPLSRFWDRSLEMGLPDSRLSGPRRRATMVPLGRMMMERVYCANCGGDGGLITADWSAHVFFVCDGCVETIGKPPGCIEADEGTIRGKL
jgi:hypothetical protein